MKYILSDNGLHLRFAPFTLTRPLGTVRMGIMTNEERICLFDASAEVLFQTEDYLTAKFPSGEDHEAAVTINAQVILSENLMNVISLLKEGEMLVKDGLWIARNGTEKQREVNFSGELLFISQRWDLYQKNHIALLSDFSWLTKDRISQPVSDTNTIIGDRALVFLEEGASVEACILNTKTGPVYVGKNAELMEGSVVRGGLA